MSWLDRLRQGLSKTRQQFQDAAGDLGTDLQETLTRLDSIEDLEYALIAADVGRAATEEILADIRKSGKSNLQDALMEALTLQLEPDRRRAQFRQLGFTPDARRTVVDPRGHVVMVVGVNGVGKTTTIAKLGEYYLGRGKSVMFAAGDTFRAAAGAQLGVWGERLGIPVVGGPEGGDPAAVAYDAAAARAARGTDLLFVDTAGRLHTKHNLMEELKKVRRVIDKADPGEPADVWLVLDAVTGQNGLAQAKKFHEATPLTGVIVTKLDGTAKGGILIPIVRELGVPIKFIGVGEGAHDLQPFDPQAFVRALFDVEVPRD
ncbi:MULTISPECIES: signal recognition particle-docking protein FtsY [Deinococcus]|uniref:signal recognition particle-docking protein FtsY n=1 Tax=Deinococcus TaxID=1298 RepID=UPI00048A3211|nr:MULTISPECIES: signal recognition particle-docking protein FtsY [Deinococcus]KEF35202.1 cell division protein FtsY [Deinococcus sp. RL]